MKWIAEGTSQVTVGTAPQIAKTRKSPDWLPWGLVAVLGSIVAVLGFIHLRENPSLGPMPVRLEIHLPEKVSFTRSATLVLSPDGLHAAFPGIGPGGRPHLWIQDLAGTARELSETDVSADSPPSFWSPDSRYVVFSGNTKIRKVDTISGTVQDVCDKPGPMIGGSWNRDDVLILGSSASGLWKAPFGGGAPAPLTVLDSSRHEREHELPSFLPDGKHFLYLRASSVPAESGVYVGSLDDAPDRQSRTRILATNFGATYVPSNDGNLGFLLFFRDGALMAQSFDPEKLELRGEASPVAERVGWAYETPQFSVASNVLVFRGVAPASKYQLTWFDDKGRPMGKVGDPGEEFSNRHLSPDGNRVVFSRRSANNSDRDLWLMDLNRGTTMRFTFGPDSSDYPVWSPDGREIVFSSNRDGVYNLYRKAVDGSQPEQLLLRTGEDKRASSWSSDGRYLLFDSGKGFVTNSPFVLPMAPVSKPISIGGGTNFDETFYQISPNGRFVTYMSNETGDYEVYLQEIKTAGDSASMGNKVIVSKGGGFYPEWSGDGKKIAYVGNSRTAAMSAPIDTARFQAGEPSVLFILPPYRGGTYILAPSADQKRFLIPGAEESAIPQSFSVIVNWMSALKAAR